MPLIAILRGGHRLCIPRGLSTACRTATAWTDPNPKERRGLEADVPFPAQYNDGDVHESSWLPNATHVGLQS